jgi:DNA-binding CsgD family transcriptional regulator
VPVRRGHLRGRRRGPGVTPGRILVVQGRATGDTALLRQAERHLKAAWQLAEGQALGWLRLRVLILRALLADAVGSRDAALGSLTAAVAEAEPEGVIRPFSTKAPMAALLADLHMGVRDGREPVGSVPGYLGTVLAAYPGHEPGPHRTGLVEPLTERELEALRLLATGRSNAELVAELFVEQSTVTTHLYNKLGVHSRTQRWPARTRSGCWTDPAAGSTRFSTLRWTRPARHAAKLATLRRPQRVRLAAGTGLPPDYRVATSRLCSIVQHGVDRCELRRSSCSAFRS